MNTYANSEPGTDLLSETAEFRKQHFVQLVDALARLRSLQYSSDVKAVEQAKEVVAVNLPSNLIRAAATLVDWLYGFPRSKGSFDAPEWITARTALPKERRGLLFCKGFKDVCALEENDVIVLTCDLADEGLHAGMAGIVREIPSDEDDEESYLVEFGEPQDSDTIQARVQLNALRRPRPGDLIENYRP